MKKLILAAVVAAAFIGAQAYAFEGSVFMTGSVATHQVGTTNSVVFGADWFVLGTPAPTGAYAGADTQAGSPGDVTFSNFSYDTVSLAVNGGAGQSPLWSFSAFGNTYTFDLGSPLLGAASSSNSFIISGTGTAFINGGDATQAVWSLQSTSGGSFHFTATASTSTVPDGGSAVALLGIALAGIEGVRRMIGARKA